jgi:hypothetical protein
MLDKNSSRSENMIRIQKEAVIFSLIQKLDSDNIFEFLFKKKASAKTKMISKRSQKIKIRH